MQGLMTIFRILNFCLRLAGEMFSNLLCCLAFWNVVYFCKFDLSDGIRWMPKYVYASFLCEGGEVFRFICDVL